MTDVLCWERPAAPCSDDVAARTTFDPRDEAIVRWLWPRIERIADRLGRAIGKQYVEDLTSDVYWLILCSPGSFQEAVAEAGSIGAAEDAIINLLRTFTKRHHWATSKKNHEQPAERVGADCVCYDSHTGLTFYEILRGLKLPKLTLRLVLLFLSTNTTYAQLAAEHGLSSVAVENRVLRGNRTLRRAIADSSRAGLGIGLIAVLIVGSMIWYAMRSAGFDRHLEPARPPKPAPERTDDRTRPHLPDTWRGNPGSDAPSPHPAGGLGPRSYEVCPLASPLPPNQLPEPDARLRVNRVRASKDGHFVAEAMTEAEIFDGSYDLVRAEVHIFTADGTHEVPVVTGELEHDARIGVYTLAASFHLKPCLDPTTSTLVDITRGDFKVLFSSRWESTTESPGSGTWRSDVVTTSIGVQLLPLPAEPLCIQRIEQPGVYGGDMAPRLTPTVKLDKQTAKSGEDVSLVITLTNNTDRRQLAYPPRGVYLWSGFASPGSSAVTVKEAGGSVVGTPDEEIELAPGEAHDFRVTVPTRVCDQGRPGGAVTPGPYQLAFTLDATGIFGPPLASAPVPAFIEITS